jgi:16S rRNA (cytosine1407-C5)-methyltransferase
MESEHPFDRYAGFTDLAALKEYSTKPLRRCVRVNNILSSIEKLQKWGGGKEWQLEPVPWCKEGFFVDREDRSIPLGKDLMHLLGHFYFQEASSMLPVELLQPEPGENILDMAAAPGSKTTQIAAKMQGRGVVVANDMEERRIKTLKAALNRSGVMNVILTKRMGQWFGKNMTGRFDRVLIDAPCTAQGTSRKDADALNYCSVHSIGKAAKLQRELLESAVHAAKIGGRIVYSTCTLCPEENEEVVQSILNKFSTQLEVLDPTKMALNGAETMLSTAVQDSLKVQGKEGEHPFLRIWPQTYDTEGFFCAVLKKTAPTREAEKVELKHFREEKINVGAQREMSAFLRSQYGTDIVQEDEDIFDDGEHLSITTRSITKFKLPTVDYSIGMPFGKKLRDVPVYIDHEMAVLRGADATENVCIINDVQLQQLLQGKDIECDVSLHGHTLIQYKDMCIGRGRARDGKLKNHLPRWMIYQLQDVA